jgi:hypothetical protein
MWRESYKNPFVECILCKKGDNTYLYKSISYKEMTSKQRRREIATLNLRISYTTVTTPASRTADKSIESIC